MKKTSVFIMIAVICLIFTSCKGETVKEPSTEITTASVTSADITKAEKTSAEGKNEKEETQKDKATEKETEKNGKKDSTSSVKENPSEETTKKSNGVKMTMEVYSDENSFRIENSEKVGDVYAMLSALKYEKTKDEVNLSGGTGVYFYNEKGEEVNFFFIKDNYMRIGAEKETYIITDKSFDYKEFKKDLIETVGNDLELE